MPDAFFSHLKLGWPKKLLKAYKNNETPKKNKFQDHPKSLRALTKTMKTEYVCFAGHPKSLRNPDQHIEKSIFCFPSHPKSKPEQMMTKQNQLN